MKKFYKRGIALLCAMVMLLSVLPAVSAADDTAEFAILSTTDMHGRCWDTNILNDTAMNNSMLNVATAVAKYRGIYGENIVLVDNGDTYQGTPVSTLQISEYTQGNTTDPNPMAISMKYIGYDAATAGNHEFNYAWSTMSDIYDYLNTDVEGLKSFPAVCANLYYENGDNVLLPYTTKMVKASDGSDIKVAILCFVTPDCTRWDVPDNYPGMRFSHPDNPNLSMRWEAQKWVSEIQEKEAPDFLVVSFHSGLGSNTADADLIYGANTENQVYSMIAGTTGIDMVIAGHDHSESYSNKTYKNADGDEVLVVNGGGNCLTVSTFTIEADGNIILKSSVNDPLKSYKADAGLKELIKKYADAADAYVNKTCGKAIGNWNSTNKFYLQQSDTMDLIGRAQMAQGSVHLAEKFDTEEKLAELFAETGLTDIEVDLSSTSVVVNGSYNVKAGDLSMKDIYRMYKYDNSLYLLPVSGKEIKDILEFNAATHLTASTASGTPVFGTIGDDFTNPIFYGIDFKYDMSREKYDRIIGLKFADGREVVADEMYILAVNNYHLGNASGPFSAYTTEDCIWSQTDDMGGGFVQDLIAEFLAAETAKNGGVAPAPSNWEIVYTGEIIAGEATGKYIGELVADPNTLVEGEQIMIFHVAGAQTLSNIASGTKLAPCTDVTVGEGKIGTDDESALFTVVKGADGKFRFVDAAGKFLTSGETGNGLSMTAEESPYSQWEFEATTGGFYLHNVNAAYNGNANQYLEYYNGAFTTYGLGGGGGAYLINVYKVGAEEEPEEPKPEDPKPEDPKPEECLHEEYEIVGAKDPTCTENGYTGDPICTACGETIGFGIAIPATGHDYSKIEVTEPTCTMMGYTKNSCANCDSYYRNNFVVALGHDYQDGACTRCGEIEEVKPEEPKPEEPEDPQIPTAMDPYKDLKRGAWYSVGVTYALENGLMIGVSEDEFAPNSELTRAMFVTILYRMAGCPDVSFVRNPYIDVEDDQWYTDAILWATSNGIVNGISDGYFAPDEVITREQMVTILWRFANKPEASNAALRPFSDRGRVSAYAQTAMAWAVEEGLINGIEGKLAPTATATRAQTAVIFYRYQLD